MAVFTLINERWRFLLNGVFRHALKVEKASRSTGTHWHPEESTHIITTKIKAPGQASSTWPWQRISGTSGWISIFHSWKDFAQLHQSDVKCPKLSHVSQKYSLINRLVKDWVAEVKLVSSHLTSFFYLSIRMHKLIRGGGWIRAQVTVRGCKIQPLTFHIFNIIEMLIHRRCRRHLRVIQQTTMLKLITDMQSTVLQHKETNIIYNLEFSMMQRNQFRFHQAAAKKNLQELDSSYSHWKYILSIQGTRQDNLETYKKCCQMSWFFLSTVVYM